MEMHRDGDSMGPEEQQRCGIGKSSVDNSTKIIIRTVNAECWNREMKKQFPDQSVWQANCKNIEVTWYSEAARPSQGHVYQPHKRTHLRPVRRTMDGIRHWGGISIASPCRRRWIGTTCGGDSVHVPCGRTDRRGEGLLLDLLSTDTWVWVRHRYRTVRLAAGRYHGPQFSAASDRRAQVIKMRRVSRCRQVGAIRARMRGIRCRLGRRDRLGLSA
jgi:hypothetical protein